MSAFRFNGLLEAARRRSVGGLSSVGGGENGAPGVDPVEAFELWMRNHKDSRGNRKFTDAKIRKRIEAFQGCRKIFRDARISEVPLELIDDPDTLEKLESAFLSCPEYRRQTEKYRNRLIAAFHVYETYRRNTQKRTAPEGRLLPLDGDFQEFADSVPVRYKIGDGDERRVETWADLLVLIVESELARNNPRLEAFNFASPIPSLQPLFMENELSNVECRQLSTGRWINVDWSTPLMIQSIKAVCRSCGYDEENIRIWIKDQKDDLSEDDSEQEVAAESDDLSDDEATDIDWTSDDLSDSEQPDDVTPDELTLYKTFFDESPEWTKAEELGDAPQGEEEVARTDDETDDELNDEGTEESFSEEEFASDEDEFEEDSGDEAIVDEPEDESDSELELDDETEADDENVVLCRFDNYREFAETAPDACRIGKMEDFSSESWKGFLVKLVNQEINREKPEIELLREKSLPSLRSGRPFFFSDEIVEEACRTVSNGLKISLGYDTPQILEIIVDFCRFVGYKDSEIVLRGRKKTSSDWLRYNATGRSMNVNYPKPGKCRVGLEIFKEETWADILYCIVEHEVKYPNKLSNNTIWILYEYPLESTQPGESFFLEEEPQGRICRQLSNGRWIDLDYDDKRLERIIRDFCKVAGYGARDISIGYEKKSLGQPTRDSVNVTATERPTNDNYPKPGKCRVDVEFFEEETWADLLYRIVEHEIEYPNILSNNAIWNLYDEPLESTQSDESFFLKEKPQGRICRYLPCIHRWIDLDYDDERLEQIIRDFCKVAGYESEDISIVYEENFSDQMVRESASTTATERSTSPQTPLIVPSADASESDSIFISQSSAVPTVIKSTNADVSRPAHSDVSRVPKEGLICFDWDVKNYDDFEGTVPCECSIGGRKFSKKTWTELLQRLASYIRPRDCPKLRDLFSHPLLPLYGDKPFYMKEETKKRCGVVSINNSWYWINLDYSDSQLVEIIVEFCVRAGYERDKICLYGRKNNAEVLTEPGLGNGVGEQIDEGNDGANSREFVAADLIPFDSDNYADFDGTEPYECQIAGRFFAIESWSRLFKIIVDFEYCRQRTKLKYLRWGKPPFFRWSKPSGTSGERFQQLDSSRYWIEVKESASECVRDIVLFCRRCGYDDSQISIVGRKINGDILTEDVNDSKTLNDDATNREKTFLPPGDGELEPMNASEKQIVRCDFANYDKFERTIPIDCHVGWHTFSSVNSWTDFLYELVRRVNPTMRPKLRELFTRQLPSSRGGEPFYMREKTEGQNCRSLTIGGRVYWINRDYSCPRLVRIIVEFCERAGFRYEEIILYGMKKNEGSLTVKNGVAPEPK